jgi:hypothetical protein
MPGLDEKLIEAVEHAAGGAWERAHEIVQEHEDDRVACWIHALVHRIEGDLDNARYWYRRCGRTVEGGLSVEAELAQIRSAIGGAGPGR